MTTEEESTESGFTPEEEEKRQEAIRRWKEWAADEQTRAFAIEATADAQRTLTNLYAAAKESTDPVVRGLANRYEVVNAAAKLLRGET